MNAARLLFFLRHQAAFSRFPSALFREDSGGFGHSCGFFGIFLAFLFQGPLQKPLVPHLIRRGRGIEVGADIKASKKSNRK